MIVEIDTLLRFVLTAGAIVISPGPDTLLIIRNTLGSGQRVGYATVAGVQLGLVVHTLLAVLGVSVVIASSPILFKTVAIAGAGYLAWLAITSLRDRGGALALGGRQVAARRALRDALLTNVLNPKVIVLFLALLPNFVRVERGDTTAQLLVLAAVLVGINVVWQAPLAFAAQAARRHLLRDRVRRTISRATGAVLMVFAVLMLWDNLIVR